MTPENTTPPLVLASSSPRRIELFQKEGLSPVVRPSSYEEVLPYPLPPHEQAMFFALGKALNVRDAWRLECPQLMKSQNTDGGIGDSGTSPIIVGADTIVVFQGKAMGKPGDKEDGMEMLMGLCGNTHSVITGVCLAHGTDPLVRCFYEESRVTFTTYTKEEMDAYLDTPEPYDKAGGYAIQETFKKYISAVDGDVTNIIGFPMPRFLAELAQFAKA